MTVDTESARAIPKVELHCHIEGTMRTSTVAELAAKNGIALAHEDPAQMYAYEDLTGFLEIFWLVQSVLQTPDDWEHLAYESLVDGAAHGLRYREAFFTPARHLLAGQSLADIVAALDRGLARAERDSGARGRLIFDIDREFGPDVATEQVTELVDLRRAGSAGTERVIGLGMDSTELGVDPRSFSVPYGLAREAGLRLTAHQGENSPASAVASAIDDLGCERIDHGISVFEDPELVRRVADRRIPFTVCPNANVRINPDVVDRVEDHVFDKMRRAGILAALNTDDPALVGLDLTAEYELTAQAYGYGLDELYDIAADAVDSSWLDDSDAAALRAEITASRNASAPPDR
ncbi:MAG: adenosine deaminase [Actinomycetota bacterium]